MKKRDRIPKAIEHDVLMRNQNVCCICRKQNVQIHHIDGDPTNNALTNLCVLCIEHHAQASSKSAMTKGLEPSLLGKYKRHWESVIATNIGGAIPRERRRISKGELTNLRFEVKRTIFTLPSLKTNQHISSALEYLYHLNFDVHILSYVLRDIGFLHWFMDAKHIEIISVTLYQFFWHLIGPHKVPFSAVRKNELSQAIELLSDMGEHVIVLGYRLESLKRIVETLKQFGEIGKIYKNEKTRILVRKAHQKMYETCKHEHNFNKSKVLQAKMKFLQRTSPG